MRFFLVNLPYYFIHRHNSADPDGRLKPLHGQPGRFPYHPNFTPELLVHLPWTLRGPEARKPGGEGTDHKGGGQGGAVQGRQGWLHWPV